LNPGRGDFCWTHPAAFTVATGSLSWGMVLTIHPLPELARV